MSTSEVWWRDRRRKEGDGEVPDGDDGDDGDDEGVSNIIGMV